MNLNTKPNIFILEYCSDKLVEELTFSLIGYRARGNSQEYTNDLRNFII